MLQHIREFLPPVWTVFLVLCICLGFLADVFTAWSLVGNHADTATSVLAALAVYLAIGVAVLSGGYLATWAFKKARRLKRGRRDADKFKALAPDIGKLRDRLRQGLEELRVSGPSPGTAEVLGIMLVEAEMLTRRLDELGIPDFDEDDGALGNSAAHIRLLITYLSALEKAALSGDLLLARSDTFKEMFQD